MFFSVIIPVYNSTASLEVLLEEISSYFVMREFTYEVILVNDASKEETAQVMRQLQITDGFGTLQTIHLEKNGGQQKAVMIGLKHASGQYAITMDDDLQHDIASLDEMIAAAMLGADLIYGIYEHYSDKQSRAFGSKIIALFFKLRYHKSLKGKRVSSFRLIHADIYRALPNREKPFVYVSAELLPLSKNVANVNIARRHRRFGKSGYSLAKCIKIGMKLYFHYGIKASFERVIRREGHEAHAHGRRGKLPD